MLLPDHPTPLAIKTHSSDPVPYAIYTVRAGGAGPGGGVPYDEASAAGGNFFEEAYQLMDHFLRAE